MSSNSTIDQVWRSPRNVSSDWEDVSPPKSKRKIDHSKKSPDKRLNEGPCNSLKPASHSNGNQCRNCKKTCQRLLQHLLMKPECQRGYDLEELRSGNSAAERKRKQRANLTEDQKKLEKLKDAERHHKRRKDLNDEDKKILKQKKLESTFTNNA